MLPTKKPLILGLLLCIGAASIVYGLRTQSPAVPAAKQPALVSVTLAHQQDLPLALSAQGHLVALNQVDLRPQLTATITAIHFKEGDDVSAGQLLFTLDDADARAQLRRAQGQAAQIEAQLADARRDYARSAELVKSHFITSSAVDTAASKADALQAQLTTALADIDSARLLLTHTRIVAPVAARTGAVTVHPGSLAQTSAATPLVTLVQQAPIGVEFNLPEQYLAAILKSRAQGPVMVRIDGADQQTVTGELTFVNNVVNPDSGTISLKATLPNQQRALWPGAYARVTLLAGTDHNAVVLPPQAVLEGPEGRFVYLAGADGKATRQAVSLLRVQDGMAVLAGLAGGSRVVLEGGANLRPGDPIRTASASDMSKAASGGAP